MRLCACLARLRPLQRRWAASAHSQHSRSPSKVGVWPDTLGWARKLALRGPWRPHSFLPADQQSARCSIARPGPLGRVVGTPPPPPPPAAACWGWLAARAGPLIRRRCLKPSHPAEETIEKKGVVMHGAPMYLDMQARAALWLAGVPAFAPRLLARCGGRQHLWAQCLSLQQLSAEQRVAAQQAWRSERRLPPAPARQGIQHCAILTSVPHSAPSLVPILHRPPPPWTLASSTPCCLS